MPGTTLAYQEIIDSVDESLKRLETPYIDLLQIHWPDRYVPLFGGLPYDLDLERDDVISFEEQLRAMQDLIKAGKVRYFGVSNETPYGLCTFAQLASKISLPKLVSVQNSYSLLNRCDIGECAGNIFSDLHM